MNRVVEQIVSIIKHNIAMSLPDVAPSDLEGSGLVYYMNGKNGTEFDWFVNEHLPAFMVFYDDEANLGAAKACVYDDGAIHLYLYSDRGNTLAEEVETTLDVEEGELLALAVTLKANADDKRIWDEDIAKLDTDAVPDDVSIADFVALRSYFEPSIRRRELLDKFAVVSKRITEDRWKVGYMSRDLPHDEEDSGWELYAGNEDDDFVEDVSNFVLLEVGYIVQIDPTILPHIDAEAGARLVRAAEDEFVQDQGQDPYLERW